MKFDGRWRQYGIISRGRTTMKKETQTIEFKQSWHDEYLEWICGYANAYGGTLYIGRTDDGGG
jgi:predicted HTH transcriptional regulator